MVFNIFKCIFIAKKYQLLSNILGLYQIVKHWRWT